MIGFWRIEGNTKRVIKESITRRSYEYKFFPRGRVFLDDAAMGRAGMSRRDFIKGIIATGASISAMGYVFGGCAGDMDSAPGAVERLISLNVNGRVRRVDVLPQETLAMTLRYKLGLTGTKLGCDRGECGACTVLVDDVAMYSCSTLTHRVRGRSVVTVEGPGRRRWRVASGSARIY